MHHISYSADTMCLAHEGLPAKGLEGRDVNRGIKPEGEGAASVASEATSSKLGPTEGGAPLGNPSPLTASWCLFSH